jgi:hypothetical protein
MNRKHTLRIASFSDTALPAPAVPLTTRVLAQENRVYWETGGVSAGNRDQDFRPAFQDQKTGTTWLSRFADGRIAPLHVLDGLPDELVDERDRNGHVKTCNACVIAGFLRGGLFYTREQAARAVAR